MDSAKKPYRFGPFKAINQIVILEPKKSNLTNVRCAMHIKYRYVLFSGSQEECFNLHLIALLEEPVMKLLMLQVA